MPVVREALRRHRAAIVVAEPGAGKTTRIPPALVDDGPVILLQPRRVAARAIARRIATERGWTVGREVGWHVRFERQFTATTRLVVATEGILTARLQQDALLSDIHTVVLDEFHERSIHADLGIALARQAWRARADLRLLIMSATLDAAQVAAFLDDAPVINVPGAPHPLEIVYRAGVATADAAGEALTRTSGQVLCFLPGAREIGRAAAQLRPALGPAIDVVELHGSLSADEQDRALQPARGRRVIVATNIAETSLTVPGVSAVVDSGQHKVARYDAGRAVDSLEIERISLDAADQRAGRAARLGPGLALRLWSERDRLRPRREPDVARIDLSAPALDIFEWGGDPRTFEWFEAPDADALDAAIAVLRMLGALDGSRLSPAGRRMARLPVHPRLGRILIEADGAYEAAVACALLAERQTLPQHPPTTSCDLLVADEAALPAHVRRHANELMRVSGVSTRTHMGERELQRALLAGYPDRVAQRRGQGEQRVLLTSGHGAVLAPESGVRDGMYLLALDVQAGARGEGSEARVRIASAVEPEWLTATSLEHAISIDQRSGTLRSTEREMYGALVLRERPVEPETAVVERRLAAAFLERPLTEADQQLVRRLAFAGIDVDLVELARRAAAGRRRIDDIRLEDALDWQVRREIDQAAPPRFTAPSGRTRALNYRADGAVELSIKLQELFGLAQTPLIGSRREPLLIVLLAPNGRPVQTTRDLQSFWNNTYPEVRRELRGRYPKHRWPQNPWEKG